MRSSSLCCSQCSHSLADGGRRIAVTHRYRSEHNKPFPFFNTQLSITYMRLFLFLVGGTGSRVMRPLIMQLASGVRPKTAEGRSIPIEVVPIVVDPHKANQDLKRTENMMRWYKQLRRQLYGELVDVPDGFFAAKLSTLGDIVPDSAMLSDNFVMSMAGVESKKFSELIDYSTLDSGNQALCSMMFADYQLDTKMDIGFVGSPNIGSVALNQLKDSEEFKQFSNVFRKEDRIFVVSSIFGGTGAAGYPIIVKNIRNAAANSAINNRGDLRNAKIGALTVLPYFNVQQDENSPISRADFISKTKSALYYYHDNLTGLRHGGNDLPLSKVNACYYLGDEVASNPYFNDPGGGGQRNDAHLVEYVGALSILDFMQLADDELRTVDGNAVNPIYKEYGLANDKMVLSLKDFGLPTRQQINRNMVKFHLAYMYITHHLRDDIGRGYTVDRPQISKSFLSSTFYNTLTSDFFVGYRQWLKEMKTNQRSFVPFNLNTVKLSDCLTDIAAKSSLFRSAIDYNTVLAALNKASQTATRNREYDADHVALKLLDLLSKTLDKLVDERFVGVV